MSTEFTKAVRFECTSLRGTNKKGLLPKDENGYRWMPIGGLPSLGRNRCCPLGLWAM